MNWRDVLFVAMFFGLLETWYHAKEAHKHSHEAACAAGHEPTCAFVE